MLSAFTARPIIELRARDKSKIESILAYGDRLFVGLNTGSLRIYRVNEIPVDKGQENGIATSVEGTTPTETASPPPKPVDLLRDVEKFSTRGIEQLAFIREANVLISLSNYYVWIHDSQTYTLQEQLVKTKNATTFAVTSNIVKDSASGILEIISRLAVAVKRRLLLWSWHEAELEPNVAEITLAESIRTLTWASATKIVCGMNSGYVIVDVLTQEIEDIVGPGAIGGAAGVQGGRFGSVGSTSMGYIGLGGYIPKPLSTRLAEGELLLTKDINSLFITSEGKPEPKRQIPWQLAPEAIGYSYPYILALQAPSKGALEVRNPETLSLLQTIALPNATQLHFPAPGVSLPHAGKGFHVASDRCIWQMGTTDYDTQVDELVNKGLYDEAISILNMLEDALLRNKAERLRETKILKAQRLFDQRKYRDAIDIFLSEDVQAPPERVIRLYPPVIAGELSTFQEKSSEDSDSQENGKDTNEDGATTLEHKQDVADVLKPAAISKLLKPHKKTVSDAGSIRSFMRLDNGDGSDTASLRQKQTEDAALEGKDLITAALELNSFLVDARNRMKRWLDPETGKLIPQDSTSNGRDGPPETSFESFLVAPASDAEKDREQKLKDTAKLIDTTLFRSYMLARPQLAGSLFRIPNFCDPDVVNEKLLESGRYNDLVDFFHGKKLHRPALELLKKFGTADDEDENSPLHGPQRTVGYLQNLPPEMIDLILEFAEWPLRANPELGMEIFLADTENAETLSRERVLKFLQGIDVDLAVKYLEHVINELNDMNPEFHNELVSAYLKDLKEQEDRDSEHWKDLMSRLITFLRTSKQYHLNKAFQNIPKDDPGFYEPQAIVLSTLGQHKQALAIYVFKIKDFQKAEEYCNYVHLQSDSSTTQSSRASTTDPEDPVPSIYHTILSLYLTPPPPYTPNWPPALELLSKHGSRLPAASTMNLIPDTLPIAELESYFRGRIRSANSIVNEVRIVAGLRKTEVVSAQSTLLLGDSKSGGKGGRNRGVYVEKERVCGVCHKRLGRSVIAVLPDNEVVHYGCLNRADKRPVGGGMDSLRSASRRQ